MRTRHGHRKDKNHNAITEAFRANGCPTVDTHMIGDGFPDFIAAIDQTNVIVEVKDDSQPASKRKLTEDEEKFHNTWPGLKVIIENEQQAVEFIRSIREAGY